MRKSLPCSEVLPPPPESCREESASAVADELCRIPVVVATDDCEICDCAEERPPCCDSEACEIGLRCDEDTEDGRPDLSEAELRSEAEWASSIWRSRGVDKFFRILVSYDLEKREVGEVHFGKHAKMMRDNIFQQACAAGACSRNLGLMELTISALL